ncbi:MAG: NAD-glutamate dehydrogenase, partial [Pseudomonadota bacterium]
TMQTDDAEKQELLNWYCKAFIQDSDPDEVERYSPENIGQYIQMSFDFLAHRPFGKASVRVYSPDKNKSELVGRTIIEIVNDDMPFLIDSVTQFLAERDIEILDFFHPICRVKRDKEGNFTGFSELDGHQDGLAESIMQLHVPRLPHEAAENEFTQKIKTIMQEVRKAISDWQVMMRRLDKIISDFTAFPVPVDHNHLLEVTGFLRWLGNNHFTFLGAREYRYDPEDRSKLKQVPDSGLGLFRDPGYYVLRQDGDYVDVIDGLNDIGRDSSPITILKSNRKTNVHRFAHMDQIFITIYEEGEVVGQYCFIGLFTSTAYSARAKNIPLLSHKVHEIMRRSGFRPTGHDGKTLTHILDTYPRDELFQTDVDDLYGIVMGIMKVEIRPTIRLFSRHDRFNRFVTAMVYIPRERLNTDARRTVGELLANAFGGRLSTFSLWFGENNYVRIKYIIAVTPNTVKSPDFNVLEAEIKRITANWTDAVREAMYGKINDADIGPLVRHYAHNFPQSYREIHNAADAVRDIEILEKVYETQAIIPHIITGGPDNQQVICRIFSPNGALPLSDCLPIFENLGFRVLSENPHPINARERHFYLHEFVNENVSEFEFEFSKIRDLLSEAFLKIYHGQVENDAFNKLTLASGLSARQVSVLRAFSRYLKQAGISYSQRLIGVCLVKHATISYELYAMFDTLHNPDLDMSFEERKAQADQNKANILEALKDVTVLDEDTIIRRMMNAIRSVLRTNVFQKHDYLAFKFDCAHLHDLPLPRPYREIWVYSPRVEGVHLRFGKVARGGLRWSDRQEDFRTEILGLVKAQQVKNAVIVPVGAKGGFYAKQLPDMNIVGRDVWMAEGVAAYKIFISALLDVTDNIVKGDIFPPKKVVCYDDDDPYLVVAADKGTATFSDIANDLAIAHDFWLRDAFASGGSVGYDHKKMGITARGAWEAVKRHFRELGKDIQTEDFTVIGVGDMSGDVFGNGMLLSRKINLIAAFDHRDIFIDPAPLDTEQSYLERERLFNLPRSSWQDYKKDLISQGGGVFSRNLKSINLTPEIRALTGLTGESTTPHNLISALLKAKADLLWFGGIGTYVKSNSERNSQVGDKANDLIRVNGTDLRVKVIGEGANLGLTQKGRIEFALSGGYINTDAVDNSAGVDCSDHEVNIKIALGHAMAAEKLSTEERNTLLASMTDEVSELVLQTNYDQTRSLSTSQNVSQDRLQTHSRFLNYLEKHADLNRDVEYLPEEKVIFAGRSGYKGLMRPELSVMMAYSKLHLYKVILETSLPDQPVLEKVVDEYMPKPLKKYDAALKNHPLKREIITTVITNRAINEGGITFIFRLCERLNVTQEQAVNGYLIARHIIGFDELLQQIGALDNKIPAELQIRFYEILRKALFDQTRRVLVNFNQNLNIEELIKKYAGEFQYLSHNIEKTLGEVISVQFKDFIQNYQHEALSDDLCKRICSLYFLKNGADAIDLALLTGENATQMAKLYFHVTEWLGLDELRRKATEIPLSDVYDQKALSQIITEMDSAIYDLAKNVALSGQTPDEWFKERHDKFVKYKETFNDAVAVNVLGLSRLSIIASALHDLIA